MSIINANITSSVTTLYTSSGNSAMVVAYFCNYGNATQVLNLYAVPNGASANVLNRIYSNVTITSGDTFIMDTEKLLLSNGDTIRGNVTTNNNVAVTISYTGI